MSTDTDRLLQEFAAFRAEYAADQRAAGAWRQDASRTLSDLREEVHEIGERGVRHEAEDKGVHEYVKVIGERVDALRQDRSKALGLMAGLATAGGTMGAAIARLFGGTGTP